MGTLCTTLMRFSLSTQVVQTKMFSSSGNCDQKMSSLSVFKEIRIGIKTPVRNEHEVYNNFTKLKFTGSNFARKKQAGEELQTFQFSHVIWGFYTKMGC